ncbi:MAG: tetratricopeptide repeat protein [Anaerolineales bacterium]|nr:tetratricopeptide repeat protein [Anaerolineales bacterium]
MNINPRRPLFYRKQGPNIYRLFFLVVMILGGVWFIRQMEQGEVKPLFLPTPIPTRMAESYVMEGDAQFTAGDMDAAILAYQEALQVDPNNAEVWAKLARIQTYSSALKTTDDDQRARLQDALASAEKAVELAPDDSFAHAILAFALDWNASPYLIDPDPEQQAEGQRLLTQAEQVANRALLLDNTNTLALAFYAEILVDQQKWTQAEENIQQALERDPSLMDVHRVYAYVLESFGQYNQAIQEYDTAISITPNLTFLYLRAGANYRRLAFGSPNEETARSLYERSLEYFAKAASINEQLGVEDPIPYLSISRTYSQMGEFFIAARNVQRALEFQPDNPDVYGQLGIIYFKSRNYEGSILALKCAISGCTAEESCDGRGGCGPNDTPAQVVGMPLSPSTVVYYYTYGSVLAALSRPQENYCSEAMDVLAQVKAAYGSDPDIAGIVSSGEIICASLGSTASSAPAITPEVMIDMTATPSP